MILAWSLLASAGCCFGMDQEDVPVGTPVSLVLTVVADTGPSPVDGFTVTLEHDQQYETHVVSHGDRLALSGLAAGAYVFYAHTADGRAGYVGEISIGRFTWLEPGENEVTMTVSGGAVLAGRVTDASTGAGIEGATVSVATDDALRRIVRSGTAASDADGEYVLGALCGTAAPLIVSRDGYAPVRIAAHRFPTDCERVAPAVTLDVAMDPPPAARVTLDVVDGHPRFTRVLPGSVAARAGLRVGDRVLSVPADYDPSEPVRDQLPTFLYWLLDIEHYDGGSLTVVGEDGAERAIAIARPPELRWPGD